MGAGASTVDNPKKTHWGTSEAERTLQRIDIGDGIVIRVLQEKPDGTSSLTAASLSAAGALHVRTHSWRHIAGGDDVGDAAATEDEGREAIIVDAQALLEDAAHLLSDTFAEVKAKPPSATTPAADKIFVDAHCALRWHGRSSLLHVCGLASVDVVAAADNGIARAPAPPPPERNFWLRVLNEVLPGDAWAATRSVIEGWWPTVEQFARGVSLHAGGAADKVTAASGAVTEVVSSTLGKFVAPGAGARAGEVASSVGGALASSALAALGLPADGAAGRAALIAVVPCWAALEHRARERQEALVSRHAEDRAALLAELDADEARAHAAFDAKDEEDRPTEIVEIGGAAAGDVGGDKTAASREGAAATAVLAEATTVSAVDDVAKARVLAQAFRDSEAPREAEAHAARAEARAALSGRLAARRAARVEAQQASADAELTHAAEAAVFEVRRTQHGGSHGRVSHGRAALRTVASAACFACASHALSLSGSALRTLLTPGTARLVPPFATTTTSAKRPERLCQRRERAS